MKTLLGLLAAVALLVWGTHIVRTGLLRIYGADLRRVLAASVRNRAAALLAGMGVTTLLQSSTATALIASSFVGQGLIATAPALVFVLLVGPVARLTERLLPARPQQDDPCRPRHLDPVALDAPVLAISCAAREALRIADTVETMLVGALDMIRRKERDLSRRLRAMDDIVDERYTAVKLYLIQISREALEPQESKRWTDIVSFTINMEQIGDGVERILRDLEDKPSSAARASPTHAWRRSSNCTSGWSRTCALP